MLGEIRMLEEGDVVIGPRSGDRVPHSAKRVLAVFCLKGYPEDADAIRFADVRVR
jgi:hypothetical protein